MKRPRRWRMWTPMSEVRWRSTLRISTSTGALAVPDPDEASPIRARKARAAARMGRIDAECGPLLNVRPVFLVLRAHAFDDVHIGLQRLREADRERLRIRA